MKYTRKSRAPAAKSRAVQAQIQCIQMCFSSHFYYDSSYLNGIDPLRSPCHNPRFVAFASRVLDGRPVLGA